MQIKGLHPNIYKLYRYSRPQECLDKHRQRFEDRVRDWTKLKKEGVSDQTCQEVVGMSRATYYRHRQILARLNRGIVPLAKKKSRLNKPLWGEAEKQLILRLRRENPTYGKAKIAVILQRDHGSTLSESTVGRILRFLMSKGLVQTSVSAAKARRKRNFSKGHAKPWTFEKYDKIGIGERIQIDHMSVSKNGISFKQFQAWDRQTKFIHAQIYTNATSASAKRFLLDYINKAPFPVRSIQVDGGSEFMAEFEAACQELNIPLIVLPPKMPKYNGGVERGNRIFREEFYARTNLLADSIKKMRPELDKAILKYNTYRPHYALKGMTPMQYINKANREIQTLSQNT